MSTEPVYAIFGVESPAGEALATRIKASSEAYRVFEFESEKANITLPEHVYPLLEYIRPTVVMNCYGLDEDLCEDAKQGAFNVNSRGPKNLAEACKRYGAKLVHISSSGIFDGKSKAPYTEKAAAKPINVFGESKFSGEMAIKESCDDWLIVRPGWLFHYVNGTCVADWLSMADGGKEVPFLDGQSGSPTYAPDLAEATMGLVAKDAKGTFHIANSGVATRRQMVETTFSLAKARAQLVPVKAETQSFWKAPLPMNTVLSTKKYETVAGKPLRPWDNALKHCLFMMGRYQ